MQTFLVLLAASSANGAIDFSLVNKTNGEACCSDKCQTGADCGSGLFCCPNHFECMDTTTKSTQGPNCDACNPPVSDVVKPAVSCGAIKAGQYLHPPSKEVNPNGACPSSSCSGVDCATAIAECAVACATSFPEGCLSCLGTYGGCCKCASYELGFDCSYCSYR